MVMSEKQDNKFGEIFTSTDCLKIIIFATIGFLIFLLVAYIFAKVNPFQLSLNLFELNEGEIKQEETLPIYP